LTEVGVILLGEGDQTGPEEFGVFAIADDLNVGLWGEFGLCKEFGYPPVVIEEGKDLLKEEEREYDSAIDSKISESQTYEVPLALHNKGGDY
jgi:hypothetical protein